VRCADGSACTGRRSIGFWNIRPRRAPGYQRIAKVDRPVIGPWLGRLGLLGPHERKLTVAFRRLESHFLFEPHCREGRKVRFFSVTGLVTGLLEAREDGKLERILSQLGRQDLLILDELGYVPFTKPGAELLFEVVSRAYERQSLIVTTNLPFESWTEVLGSERLTGAMLDRLTHRVHIIEANGQSYRLRDSQRRMKRRRPAT